MLFKSKQCGEVHSREKHIEIYWYYICVCIEFKYWLMNIVIFFAMTDTKPITLCIINIIITITFYSIL